MNITPLVSVVVLSWGTKKETETCLGSLRRINYKNIQIVVVDNGSTDGSKEYLAKQKDIVYIDLPQNTGFTGGQIEAYKYAKGDYIALVNSDAVVAPNWIEEALSIFEKDKKVAAVGGRAYLWDKQHKAYDTHNPFYSYQIIDPNKGYAETIMAGNEIVEVNSISGAGVMISRKAIEKVGYFDNRFFAYYEETDLFARMKRAGYKIIYNPGIHTWHKIGVSTKDKPYFYLYQMHKNRFLFAYKNFDDKNLKKFLITYKGEFIASAKRMAMRKATLDDKARIKAYTWNKSHIGTTKKDRKKTQLLGSSYSNKIIKDASQNVSIIIPCYNYGKYVAKAIDSALNQTQKPLEVIVINDGSTDNSKEEILKYKEKVQFIDKHNEGVITTKNLGLEKAKGSWVIFLDADDYLDDKYIEKCLKFARMRDKDITYTDMKLFGVKGEIFSAKPYTFRAIRVGNFIHNSALLRTELVRAVGGYKIEMAGGYEDWELYLSMIELGAKPGKIAQPLLYYRQHTSNSRNNLAIEKGEQLFGQIISLHPGLYGARYHLDNTKAYLSMKLTSKKKYIKILWPPAWFRLTSRNIKRVNYLKTYPDKNQKISKQLELAKNKAKKAQVRSSLVHIKSASKHYKDIDKTVNNEF
jgi:GT2 family glycosyltransferase